MKNSLGRMIYHSFVCWYHTMTKLRGGWMLTHMYLNDYKRGKANAFKIASVHLKGWSYSDWSILGITDANRKSYLSTRDYCSLHPFNGVYSSWIDDKLTLKYILDGTKAGGYMPDYYFQLTENGNVLPLMDVKEEYAGKGVDGIVALLEEKSLLALKLIKGSLGVGFYKAEYRDNAYCLNGEKFTKPEFSNQLRALRGYLVTEYLLPHPEIARFCDKSVGCLRYVIGRMHNGQLQMVYSFIRLGTAKSRFVENYNSGGVLAVVRDGEFVNGNVLDFSKNKNLVIDRHPDNGVELKGKIPHWSEVEKAARIVADAMPQLTYLGIDFCVTNDDRVKIIEVNSLTSLDSIQTDCSIFDTPGGEFFAERLNRQH